MLAIVLVGDCQGTLLYFRAVRCTAPAARGCAAAPAYSPSPTARIPVPDLRVGDSVRYCTAPLKVLAINELGGGIPLEVSGCS